MQGGTTFQRRRRGRGPFLIFYLDTSSFSTELYAQLAIDSESSPSIPFNNHSRYENGRRQETGMSLANYMVWREC